MVRRYSPSMNTPENEKVAGRAVGILYITGTVLGMVSVALTSPVTGASEVLDAASTHHAALTGGAFAILGMAISLALIPVFAFPILNRVSPTLARAHALLRGVVEFGSYLPVVAVFLILASLGAHGGSESLAKTLVDQEGLSAMIAVGFLGGATVFYTALWRGRLVPRWIAGWGLVGVLPYAIATILTALEVTGSTSPLAVALQAPLGVQEMVLAVWLVVRGFAKR